MIINPWDVEWRESFSLPSWTEYELRSLRDKIDHVLKAMDGRNR